MLKREAPSSGLRPKGSVPRVLVVEDEPALARLTVALLAAAGCSAVAVRDAASAIIALGAAETPDVVILDVNVVGGGASAFLPHVDGVTTAVVLSSGSDLEDIDPAVRCHEAVRGWLAKPFTLETLERSVSAALRAVA